MASAPASGSSPRKRSSARWIRRRISCCSAREAAVRATPADVAKLRSIIAEQRQSLGKAQEFMAADMRFHIEIAAISGNPIFISASEAMLGWLKAYHTELLLWSGKENYTLAEHGEIVDAIETKDAHAAEAAMVKHLERSSGLYTSPAQLTRA